MRSSFLGFYPPSDAEIAEMWTNGSIILDTNALLNLYRYSEDTRQAFLLVLGKLNGRLWIPGQVGKEFQTRRMDVIDEQRSAFDLIRKELTVTRKSFEGSIAQFKRHSSLDVNVIAETYGQTVDAMLEDLTKKQAEHSLAFGRGYPGDTIWERITELLDERVGPPFSPDELTKVYAEGAKRYASETPPGYKDSSKGEPGKYGDLIIWKEILRRATEKGDSAIFVTDDGKEDWWRIFHGEKLGPRPELVEEYYEAAKMRIHFYTPEQFLRHAQQQVQVTVSEKSLGEIQQVSTEASDRVRAAATQRLRELVERRDRYRQLAARTHSNASDAPIEARDRLFESRADGVMELRQLDRSLLRARKTLNQTDDASLYPALLGEIKSLETMIESTRARIAEIEHRIQNPVRGGGSNQAHYLERADSLEKEITDISQALADLDNLT